MTVELFFFDDINGYFEWGNDKGQGTRGVHTVVACIRNRLRKTYQSLDSWKVNHLLSNNRTRLLSVSNLYDTIVCGRQRLTG